MENVKGIGITGRNYAKSGSLYPLRFPHDNAFGQVLVVLLDPIVNGVASKFSIEVLFQRINFGD
jgi:hypothetical protein